MSPQQILSTNTFTTARWIVSSDATQGTHTTIASALTSASSGDTIFIRPGTYTENLTLKAGVNLTAYVCDSLTPNVTIVGTCTFTAAGTVSISGIRLQTNSAALLAVTGMLASIVNLNDCYLNCTNNTGITFSSSSASAQINLTNCNGNLGTTGIAFFTSTSAGSLSIFYGQYSNSGSSITPSSTSTGVVSMLACEFNNALVTTSTGSYLLRYVEVDSGGAVVALTTAGTGTSNILYSIMTSIGVAILSIGAGTRVNVTGLVMNTSSATPIDGAGSIFYADLISTGNALGITTTSQALANFRPTLSVNIQQFTTTGTYTPTAKMAYCFIEAVGGGGGGGGAATSAGGQIAVAGGGGYGEYAAGIFSAGTIGISQSVTIGAAGLAGTAGNNPGGTGGTTSVGSTLISAVGGSGGSGAAAAATSNNNGGAGGTGGTGGTIRFQGAPGGSSVATATSGPSMLGGGGSGRFGAGAPSSATIPSAGAAGTGNGSGGSGGGTAATAQQPGGAGTKGIVVITEYIIS